MIARTNMNANETPVPRNPLRRGALNDIKMSKSEKKTESRMKLLNAF